jgi:hypothetical protein
VPLLDCGRCKVTLPEFVVPCAQAQARAVGWSDRCARWEEEQEQEEQGEEEEFYFSLIKDVKIRGTPASLEAGLLERFFSSFFFPSLAPAPRPRPRPLLAHPLLVFVYGASCGGGCLRSLPCVRICIHKLSVLSAGGA